MRNIVSKEARKAYLSSFTAGAGVRVGAAAGPAGEAAGAETGSGLGVYGGGGCVEMEAAVVRGPVGEGRRVDVGFT
jgi:hypothetical protein